jgi:predicted phosphoadenosine phosphosulfate sulfurtransferase
MCGIEYEAQLGGFCDLKRHGDYIAMPLSANNRLAIHDATWQIWKTSADECIHENQPGLLNPTSVRIESWAFLGLVKVSWQEMQHYHRAIVPDNLGNG